MNVPWTEGVDARLAKAVRELFPPGVAVAAIDPRREHEGLFPEEIPAIAGAVESRRREYTAGRVAARQAMAELCIPGKAILCGEDRAPIWPDGIAGSISHTSRHCVAVVARSSDIRSLGVDIEPDEPLDENLLDSICTAREIAWLGIQPPWQRLSLAKLMFSAKESAYKCQYPMRRELLEFCAIEIGIAKLSQDFTYNIFDKNIEFLLVFNGKYNYLYDSIITTAYYKNA